jgi:hypothetical protein
LQYANENTLLVGTVIALKLDKSFLGEFMMIFKEKFKRKEAGLTYIELIIVGAIIGIITASSILIVRANLQSMKINSTVGLIKNQIRMIRAEAIHRGTNQTMKFDQSGNRLLINGTTEIPLPDEVELKNINIANSTLTFTPTGNCSGNRLETVDIMTEREVGYRIRIIGATGVTDSFPLHR